MHGAGAFLAISHDVALDAVADYLRWHGTEHLPERLALPGFLRARRYERRQGPGQQFLCVIDAAAAAFASPAYQARLEAPTEWTRRLMPHYRRVRRVVCRLALARGDDAPPLLGCLWLDGAAPGLPAVRDLVGDLVARRMIGGARLGLSEAAETGRDSEERRLRRGGDAGAAGGLLLVGGNRPAPLLAALDHLAAALTPAAAPEERTLYALSHEAWAPG